MRKQIDGVLHCIALGFEIGEVLIAASVIKSVSEWVVERASGLT
jgi:hypothetical protein